jgi:hypothetical protein
MKKQLLLVTLLSVGFTGINAGAREELIERVQTSVKEFQKAQRMLLPDTVNNNSADYYYKIRNQNLLKKWGKTLSTYINNPKVVNLLPDATKDLVSSIDFIMDVADTQD